MSWKIYPASEIPHFANQWDMLNANSVHSPLLTSQFLLCALKHFGTGNEKLLCRGKADSPNCMLVVTESKKGSWETFQPSQAPIGFCLIHPELDLEKTFQEIIRALPSTVLVLAITQQDPALVQRIHDHAQINTLDYINTARIQIEGTFDAYWEARGKNLRQNMRKARNRLEKAGLSLRLECINTPDLVEQAITDYARLENAGWKAQDGTAVSIHNGQGAFYKQLLTEHCHAGHGRIYRLMFNDTVAAMDLCIDLGNTIVILKTTYDESLAEYSPAMLMHQVLFQELFETSPFKLIEFYGKVMEWHTRFTEDTRTMYHINIYRWGWVKKLAA